MVEQVACQSMGVGHLAVHIDLMRHSDLDSYMEESMKLELYFTQGKRVSLLVSNWKERYDLKFTNTAMDDSLLLS